MTLYINRTLVPNTFLHFGEEGALAREGVLTSSGRCSSPGQQPGALSFILMLRVCSDDSSLCSLQSLHGCTWLPCQQLKLNICTSKPFTVPQSGPWGVPLTLVLWALLLSWSRLSCAPCLCLLLPSSSVSGPDPSTPWQYLFNLLVPYRHWGHEQCQLFSPSWVLNHTCLFPDVKSELNKCELLPLMLRHPKLQKDEVTPPEVNSSRHKKQIPNLSW